MIAWFLVPTVVILGVVAIFAFSTYQQMMEDLVLERNEDVARLLADQLAAELMEYANHLSLLAESPQIVRFDPLVQQTLLRLASRNQLESFDGGIVILDKYGRVTAADPRRLETVGQDWSERPYVRMTLEELYPGLTISDIVPDGPGEASVIALAIPILSEFNNSGQREILGVMVGMFRLDTIGTGTFYRNINKLRIGHSGRAYLVDDRGRVIYHADPLYIGGDMTEHEAVQRVLDGEVGGIRARDIYGHEIIAGYSPVWQGSWGLVIEEDWRILTASSWPYRRLLLGLLALAVLVPAGIIAVGAGKITRPLTKLSKAAQEVASGNFDQGITVDSGDELEALAQQFNIMAAQLQASYATLEQRVEDRTRELAAVNAIAAVVSRSLDLDEILHDALDKTLEVMNLDVGVAYCLEEDGKTLTLIASRGLSKAFTRNVSTVPLAHSVAGPAVRAERPTVRAVSDYPESALKHVIKEEGLRMAVGVPLIAKGEVVGAINLASRVERDITSEELSLLAAVGQQAGMAVDNARLYESAEETAILAERHRLARDLHDAVTQTLFSASLIADVLPMIWERKPEEGRRRLQELRELTRGALAEMRTLLLELRPSVLEETAIEDLLKQLGEATTGRARLPVTVEVQHGCTDNGVGEGLLTEPLSPKVKIALYRIAQEALNNITKHARAEHAWLTFRREPERVVLRIRDNGCGFDPARIPPNHLGVGIMRERAETIDASFSVTSEPGGGTEIEVVWSDEQD
jgi:nitrate/nitrite-specific signal transduction histidine kinase